MFRFIISLSIFLLSINSIAMSHHSGHSMNTNVEAISIKDPWIRAMPPKALSTAAFMIIENNMNQGVELVSANIEGVKSVELHKTIADGNVMKMVKQDSMPIGPKSSLTLKPKSWHIMMIGLNKDFPEGSRHQLQLNFSNGNELIIPVTVQKRMGSMKPMHHMH